MPYKIKVKKLPKSEAVIEVEIEPSALDKARVKALENLNATLEIPGFRKGKTPEKVMLEKVSAERLLEESAEIAINSELAAIIKESELDTIGKPVVEIKKMAWRNPLIFDIKMSVMPNFELPDYKKIAKNSHAEDKESKDVFDATDKEVDEVILQIRKNKAHYDWHKKNPEEKDRSTHPDFDKEEHLPALDDELAKSAGNFKDIAELKVKVKENLINEKKQRASDKKRAEIMQGLLKETDLEIPDILVESEIDKSIAQMKDDIERMKGKFEDYLSHIKKTEEDLRQDLRKESEERAKIQLIFNKIAEKEKIVPDAEVLENEVKKIKELYPDAREDSARIYVSTILKNAEVLKILSK